MWISSPRIHPSRGFRRNRLPDGAGNACQLKLKAQPGVSLVIWISVIFRSWTGEHGERSGTVSMSGSSVEAGVATYSFVELSIGVIEAEAVTYRGKVGIYLAIVWACPPQPVRRSNRVITSVYSVPYGFTLRYSK
jgi:hypothetical protein